MSLTPGNLTWLVLYLATMAGVVFGLNYAREMSLKAMASPEAQAEWDEFRQAMQREQQDPSAPVARRAPASPEPPTLRLLRDYFGTTLLVSLVLSSALFLTLMVMIRGVFFSGSSFTPRAD